MLPSFFESVLQLIVRTSTDLPPALVSALLDEASAIWSAAGVRFEWRGAEAAGIRVLIGGGGSAANEPLPLGWIAFDDDGRPAPQIFLSYTNALTLLSGARNAVGRVQWMTLAQQRIYLSRALGRALAHELGHYLFATKQHTATGLMKARHSSDDLFGPDRRPFEIDRSQRDGLAARLARRIRASIG